ncbi:MAG: S8 family serine peptidase [Bacteroidota bacterium]
MKKNYSSGLLSGLIFTTIFLTGIFVDHTEAMAARPDGTIIRGERPPIEISAGPDEAIEQGIIRIKFNKILENHLDQVAISTSPDGSVSFGISSIDRLNQQFGVSEVKKTFDAALQNTKYTDRHREWGFHLWFDLIVPAGTDIRSMVMAYSSKNEIQLSEPVYRKQLIGAEINDIQPPAPAGNNTGLNYVPNDPRYNEQWHYHNTGQQSGTPDADIDLPEAWDITRGNNNVIVAIIDQGIDFSHPDLAANIWPGIGYNFVNNNAIIIPGDHGTHVSGTVAGNTNNAIGVSGIAGGSGTGDGIRLMSCQVFIGSSGGAGFGAASIWAADNGAAISQNSWGYTSPGYYEQATLDGIDYFNVNGGGTVLNGGITIYAAGNSGTSGLYYPGCYSGCFSVSATGNQDLKAWYSNYDTWVDIAAPGGETNVVADRGVLSSLTGNTYGFYQGTSMACPHVSGVAALILSLAPGALTPQNVKDILTSTTDDIDGLNPTYAGQLGSGRLNAYQALLAAQSYLLPTANFSASPATICTGSSTTFTNLSYGNPTSWNWSFPGGTPSSFSGQNPPAITYPVAGSFSVTLTVSDGVISDTETKTGYINVQNVIAEFTGVPLSIFMGGSVTFTDNSGCSPTSWEWSFPGGSPPAYSGQNPPAITYATPGTYNVTLVASKPGATDTRTKTAYITVNPVSYCTPGQGSGTIYGDYITLVQLGSINNATGASSSPYYTYYSSLSTDLTPGTEYTLTLSPGSYGSGNYLAAWIDYNKNGTFETGEKLGNILINGAAPLTGTITFTVPSGSSSGTTRMRVREVYLGTDIDPCSTYSFGETEDYNVNIQSSGKTLNLTAFLEGLYAGGSTMNQANNAGGPHFGAGIADQITIELRNAGNYGIIEHSDPNVFLGTGGSAQVTIPSGFAGSYFVTVKHRNSIETTSVAPVSFASSVVNVAFDQPVNVYGGNLLMMIDGNYVIFGGDANLDGGIDTGDMTPVDNDAAAFVSGYLPTDANGDGTVDTGDMTIVDNNAASFTGKVTP